MNLDQNEIDDALSARKAAIRQRPRRDRRKGLSVITVQKVWLVLLAALAMTVLEGAFRKWVFPSGGIVKYAMYFSKDIIFAALIIFPKRSQPSAVLKIFRDWLIVGCVLFGVGAVLSSMHGFNPVGAGLTTRAVVILPVIAWLAVPRLAGLPLRWALWLLAVLTVVNFALGIEQNHLS